jgi:hypothetical protein
MAGGLTGIALEVLSRSPKLNLKGQQK